jgi:hypothetical protein
MSTCFLKRFLPFMLTLIIGVGLGSLFQHSSPQPQYTTRLYADHHCSHRYSATLNTTSTYEAINSSSPFYITFEPPTHMTEAARRHQTYGVVELLVEYRADGTAHVLKRITTLPDGLTEEAVRVAEETQFQPEIRNGLPVTVTRVQEFIFDLDRR